MAFDPTPELHIFSSPEPELHIISSPEPEFHIVSSPKPEFHNVTSPEPELHIVSSPEPELHIVSSPEPEPEFHIFSSPEPEFHIVSSPEPELHNVSERLVFGSSPEPEPEFEVARKLWGISWPLHIYMFASLFAIFALYNIYSLVGLIYNKKSFKQRKIFVFANAMLASFNLVTSLQLFIDPYNSDEHQLKLNVNGLYFIAFGMKIPALTAAFSFIYIALTQTVKVKLYSQKLQNVKYFIAIVVIHFIVVLGVHLYLAFRSSQFQVIIICLLLFMLFSIAISVLFVCVFAKLKRLINKKPGKSPKIKMNNFSIRNTEITTTVTVLGQTEMDIEPVNEVVGTHNTNTDYFPKNMKSEPAAIDNNNNNNVIYRGTVSFPDNKDILSDEVIIPENDIHSKRNVCPLSKGKLEEGISRVETVSCDGIDNGILPNSVIECVHPSTSAVDENLNNKVNISSVSTQKKDQRKYMKIHKSENATKAYESDENHTESVIKPTERKMVSSQIGLCTDSTNQQACNTTGNECYSLAGGKRSPKTIYKPKLSALKKFSLSLADKSLRKFLVLVVVVILSSLLYCSAIIYYIVILVTESSLLTAPWPWLTYQTIARIAELGMSGTMSYLVRQSVNVNRVSGKR